MSRGGLDVSGENLPVGVTAEQTDETVVVTVTGEIDIFTVPALEATLKATVASGIHRVIVDLSAVTFFGACGIDALVTAREILAQNGDIELILHDPSPAVQRVLRVTNASDGLSVTTSQKVIS